MGQLTLLKNVPESGGGGFEKLYESVLNYQYNYSAFPDELKFNPLDYDVLVFWLTNMYFNQNAPQSNYNDVDVTLYLQDRKHDEYREFSVAIECGKITHYAMNNNVPYLRNSGGAICFMGKALKDGNSVIPFGYYSSSRVSNMKSTDLKYVAINRGSNTAYPYNADVKLTIYGMGKRK